MALRTESNYPESVSHSKHYQFSIKNTPARRLSSTDLGLCNITSYSSLGYIYIHIHGAISNMEFYIHSAGTGSPCNFRAIGQSCYRYW